MCSTTLGEKHPETIVTMHNMAELLWAQDKQKEANEIQQKIIALVGGAEDMVAAEQSESIVEPSAGSSSSLSQSSSPSGAATAQKIEITKTSASSASGTDKNSPASTTASALKPDAPIIPDVTFAKPFTRRKKSTPSTPFPTNL
jgi:hypothetical protein